MIHGKNIVIRQLELGDEEYLYKWWNDENLMEHATHVFGVLQSLDAIKIKILKDIEDGTMFPPEKRFVICKRDSMKPIGEINYCGWDKRNQKAELGIKICELSDQGKGYGIDSLYHFIDFMFRFLNLNKIELTTMVDNNRAQELYRKLGFNEIGKIREAYYDSRYGKFSDAIYMDLLRSDWEVRKVDIEL